MRVLVRYFLRCFPSLKTVIIALLVLVGVVGLRNEGVLEGLVLKAFVCPCDFDPLTQAEYRQAPLAPFLIKVVRH